MNYDTENKSSPDENTPWLAGLNGPQREAVTHGDGPLLVIAGAGSGKTRTLAHRVAHLIGTGVSAEKILLLTFTRRAAEEMLKRAAGVLGAQPRAISRIWGGTFHAMANRLLRIYAETAGLSPDFTIIDQSDAQDLMNVIRHDLGYHKLQQRFPRKSTCLSIYSRRVNGSEKLAAVLKRYYPWCEQWQEELAALFKEYVARKQKQQVLDYDDLLLYWYYLLKDPTVAESIEKRFDHILVDEYQDTNRIQAGILEGMRRKNRNIMVVGDDAQSIYSFRAATVRNILDFPTQFADTRVISLEQNYRSREPILSTTNRLIAQAKERFTKDLWSGRGEGMLPHVVTCRDESHQDSWVVEKVLEHYEQGVALRKQAVLFRASSHSASLELELTRRNIPYQKFGGLKFLEAAHIKDLIAILRILENPQDQLAWFRILQLLEGVGPATASRAFAFVQEQGADPRRIADFEAPPSVRSELRSLAGLFEDLAAIENPGPAAEIDRITRFYRPILKRVHENHEARAHDIEHLGSLAGGYRSRKRFLTELILDPPASTGDLAGPPKLDEDWLVLSTIHSAKGCEWDAVYLIHAADGCLPSDMATGTPEEIEEELRLTYVAMTRAKDFLYVTWPQRYYHRFNSRSDNHNYAQLSRFFSPEVIDTMETVSIGEKEADEDVPSGLSAGESIAERLKDMWE